MHGPTERCVYLRTVAPFKVMLVVFYRSFFSWSKVSYLCARVKARRGLFLQEFHCLFVILPIGRCRARFPLILQVNSLLKPATVVEVPKLKIVCVFDVLCKKCFDPKRLIFSPFLPKMSCGRHTGSFVFVKL